MTFSLFSLEKQTSASTPSTREPLPYDYDLFKKDTEVVFINADFLYWTAQAPGLEYAFKFDKLTDNATVFGVGKYKMTSYEWKPGFRVTLGWFNAPKYWNVLAEYSCIKIEGFNTAEKSSDSIVATFPQLATLSQELATAKSRVVLNYNFVDLLASRVFITNPHLRLRMMGGFTSGVIDQKWNIFYTDVLNQHERVFNKWKYTGIGFRVAVDFSWYWGNNIYLTAKASNAILIGRYRYNSAISADTSGDFFDLCRFKEYRGAYNIQFLLGPSYQKNFCKNRIEIFAGYELNGWINLHEINRNSASTQANQVITEKYQTNINGMLLMDGLSTRLTIDF